MCRCRRRSSRRICRRGLTSWSVPVLFFLLASLSCSHHITSQTAAFSQTRETLVGAETSNKHLEERVDDLSKQKQAAEEKLSVYERRPAGMTSPPPPGQTTGGGERELQTEVADLR